MKKIAMSVCLALVMPALAHADGIKDGLGHDFKPHGNGANKPQMHEMFSPSASATSEATVVQVINGAGYSYIEVEDKGKSWWIAGTQIEAKKGDRVQYDENVIMEDFYSKTMQRSFDRIIFASSVKVVK